MLVDKDVKLWLVILSPRTNYLLIKMDARLTLYSAPIRYQQDKWLVKYLMVYLLKCVLIHVSHLMLLPIVTLTLMKYFKHYLNTVMIVKVIDNYITELQVILFMIWYLWYLINIVDLGNLLLMDNMWLIPMAEVKIVLPDNLPMVEVLMVEWKLVKWRKIVYSFMALIQPFRKKCMIIRIILILYIVNNADIELILILRYNSI